MITDPLRGADAVEAVRGALGDKARDVKENHGAVDLVCEPQHLVEVLTTLRDSVGCRFFSFLSGVDRSELDEEKTPYALGLEVLVNVYSPTRGTQVFVHVPIDQSAPVCPSITSVFGGAIWHERECFEMFGIDFTDHPLLVNLYLPEDFDGHPGLRSFKLPARTTVKAWPGAKDPEEAAAGGH